LHVLACPGGDRDDQMRGAHHLVLAGLCLEPGLLASLGSLKRPW
jgi:hypothetical protein